MSLFDDHLNPEKLSRDTDKMILKEYRISSSKNSLIPRDTSLGSYNKHLWRRLPKMPTEGVLREKMSVFKGVFGGSPESKEKYWTKFESVLAGLGLYCLPYNGKVYYKVNRDIRRKIKYEVLK